MVFQLPQFWEVAGDGFQILLCLLVLGFFFRNRSIQRKYEGVNIKNGTGHSFNTQILNLSVEQQINQAFANIIKAISEERKGLDRILGFIPPNHEDGHISMVPAKSLPPKSDGKYRVSNDQTARAGRHDNVRKLAGKGLNARKISKVLKIPISEIELILSLQEKESGGRIFPK